MTNKWGLNCLWVMSAAHISMSHTSVGAEITFVTWNADVYSPSPILPAGTWYTAVSFTIQEDSSVSPLFAFDTNDMLARFAWNISKCLLCPWRGCYDQRLIFCTNTIPPLWLRCFPCLFANICKWGDPEGVGGRRQGLGSSSPLLHCLFSVGLTRRHASLVCLNRTDVGWRVAPPITRLQR